MADKEEEFGDVYFRDGKNRERYTPLGMALTDDVARALEAVRKKYPSVRVREFGSIAHLAVEDVVGEAVISMALFKPSK